MAKESHGQKMHLKCSLIISISIAMYIGKMFGFIWQPAAAYQSAVRLTSMQYTSPDVLFQWTFILDMSSVELLN